MGRSGDTWNQISCGAEPQSSCSYFDTYTCQCFGGVAHNLLLGRHPADAHASGCPSVLMKRSRETAKGVPFFTLDMGFSHFCWGLRKSGPTEERKDKLRRKKRDPRVRRDILTRPWRKQTIRRIPAAIQRFTLMLLCCREWDISWLKQTARQTEVRGCDSQEQSVCFWFRQAIQQGGRHQVLGRP